MKKRIILPLIMLSLGLFGLGSCDFPIISSQESTPESSSEPASSSETTSSSQESTNSSEIVITHNYGTSWEKDETHHWHACSDEDCNEISDKAVHSGGTATYTAKAKCEHCNTEYGEKVKLYCNVKFWDPSSAKFTAYFFDGCTAQFVPMTATNETGIYTCEVPADATKVIFCRMDKTTAANSWDHKWNQTGDLTLDSTKNLFTISAWDGQTSGWTAK